MDKLQLVARAIERLGGRHVGRLARWSGVLAFNYHRIGDAAESPYDQALYSATQAGFAEQMAFLARNFDVISPADVEGLRSAPKGRHVLVTFDDGYRDNFELAFPVLRALGVPATFFVTVGFLDDGVPAWWDEIAWMLRKSTRGRLPAEPWLGRELSTAQEHLEATIHAVLRRYKSLDAARCEQLVAWLADATGSGRLPQALARATWMTWDMVREMRDGGMTIGGHTVHHPVLSRLDPEAQAAEVLGTGERLRAELGEPMRWFAYPVGGRDAFDVHTRRALERAGVELAFSYYGGYRRPGDWDRYDVRRVAIEAFYDGPRFRAVACLPSLFGSLDEPVSRRLRETAFELLGR